jgi:CubicO group peptidase (beta-lactamase class C family)
MRTEMQHPERKTGGIRLPVIPGILISLATILFACNDDGRLHESHTGVNLLTETIGAKVDSLAFPYLNQYTYLLVGIVVGDEIVLTRSYGRDKLSEAEEYASVSKPVTATILFQLYREGIIDDLRDPISRYDPDFKDAQPDEFCPPEINFIHLLTHSSGVVHLDRLWKDGKLNMLFTPGTSTEYSTKGFGILGDVMETATGKSYSSLLREYVEEPAGGSSFWCFPLVQTIPGAGVHSDIEDMARFAQATLSGTYFPKDFLTDTILVPRTQCPTGTIGLGWFVLEHQGRYLGYHAGSNGKPRAFALIDPLNDNAVVLLGKNKQEKALTDLHILAMDILVLFE